MTVRPFRKEDAPTLAAIAALTLPEAWSEASFSSVAENPIAHFFVCELDGKAVGFCGMYLVADEGQIMEVAVLPDYRRRGIAKALLCELLACGAVRGAQSFSLEVRAQNEAARQLYQAMGFYEVGVRKGYYKRPNDDAVLMEKRAM